MRFLIWCYIYSHKFVLCLLKNESNLKEPSYYHHHFEYHHDSVELSLMPIQMRLAWIGPTTILVTTIIANIFQMSTPFCTPKFFCIIDSLDVKWGKSSRFTNSIFFFYLIFTEITVSFIMSSWISSCWWANSCQLMSGLHEKFIDRFISGVIHMLSTLIFCQASLCFSFRFCHENLNTTTTKAQTKPNLHFVCSKFSRTRQRRTYGGSTSKSKKKKKQQW